MGCCCSGIDYRNSTRSDYKHDENDIVCVGKLDGHDFSRYYFDVRHMKLLFKHNSYITVEYLSMYSRIYSEVSDVYMLSNEKGQRILYDADIFNNRMKNKYHEELRNKIRMEVRNEREVSGDLLLQ